MWLKKLNMQLKRKTHPMLNINEMFLKWESFRYAKSINLNMGYYHIWISEDAIKLYTIITPWGNTISIMYQWELATQQIFLIENEQLVPMV